MDENIIKILKYLEPFKYKHNGDIAPLLNEIFPYTKDDKIKLGGTRNKIIAFLDGLVGAGLIEYDRQQINPLGYDKGWDEQERWMGEYGFLVSIGLKGIEALNEQRRKDNEQLLQQSVIDTNLSVQTTNTSVIINSENQEKVLKKQTKIFFFTALFTLGTLLVTGISLYRDIHKDTLNKQLLQLSKDTLLLRNRIKTLKIDSSLHSKGVKTSYSNQ